MSVRLEGAIPCPFCGGTYILVGYRFAAICNDCGATGPDKDHAPVALKAWNKRADLTPQYPAVPPEF